MKFTPEKPYNSLPFIPPKLELETRAVLKQCIEARSSLAELNTAGRLTADQEMLINTLPVLEARDSSAIENIVTTPDRLFQFASLSHHQSADPATKEIMRYRSALYHGFCSLKERRPVTTGIAEELCSQIKGRDMAIRKGPGTPLANSATGEVIYTPPVGEELLRDLLANREIFLNRKSDLDPLIKMAVSHYQFAAIQPFTDGNGTGRILSILYLVQEDLLSLPVLNLSRYIVAHKEDYYRRLTEVTSNHAWEQWLLYMLRAVDETARWTTQKLCAIRDLHEQTAAFVKKRLPKIYSRALVNVICYQPYCRINNLVDSQLAKRETASIYLKKLCDIGILVETKVGREKLFVHQGLLHLLTEDSSSAPVLREET